MSSQTTPEEDGETEGKRFAKDFKEELSKMPQTTPFLSWDIAVPNGDVTVYGCRVCGFFTHNKDDLNKHKCWEAVTCPIKP